MASGFGAKGGLGRCYPFFEDFEKCAVKVCSSFLPVLQWTMTVMGQN